MVDAAGRRHAEDTWNMIHVPKGVELSGVSKEHGTHGSIYCIWEIERKCPCWISQSIPAIIAAINEKAIMNREKRLHASSVYRVIRGESHKMIHKNHCVRRWDRSTASLREINEHIAVFPSCVFITKMPDIWKVSDAKEGAAEAPASSGGEAVEVRLDESLADGAGAPQGPGPSQLLEAVEDPAAHGP